MNDTNLDAKLTRSATTPMTLGDPSSLRSHMIPSHRGVAFHLRGLVYGGHLSAAARSRTPPCPVGPCRVARAVPP